MFCTPNNACLTNQHDSKGGPSLRAYVPVSGSTYMYAARAWPRRGRVGWATCVAVDQRSRRLYVGGAIHDGKVRVVQPSRVPTPRGGSASPRALPPGYLHIRKMPPPAGFVNQVTPYTLWAKECGLTCLGSRDSQPTLPLPEACPAPSLPLLRALRPARKKREEKRREEKRRE